MGFDRAQIEQALVAAYYDKERTIDYLLNGIPENVLNDLSGKKISFMIIIYISSKFWRVATININ